MGNSVYSTPIVANDVLYIANKDHIFAIAPARRAEDAEGGRREVDRSIDHVQTRSRRRQLRRRTTAAIRGLLERTFRAEVVQAHGPDDTLDAAAQGSSSTWSSSTASSTRTTATAWRSSRASRPTPQLAAVPCMLITNYRRPSGRRRRRRRRPRLRQEGTRRAGNARPAEGDFGVVAASRINVAAACRAGGGSGRSGRRAASRDASRRSGLRVLSPRPRKASRPARQAAQA